jgi:hypothetical protein
MSMEDHCYLVQLLSFEQRLDVVVAPGGRLLLAFGHSRTACFARRQLARAACASCDKAVLLLVLPCPSIFMQPPDKRPHPLQETVELSSVKISQNSWKKNFFVGFILSSVGLWPMKVTR